MLSFHGNESGELSSNASVAFTTPPLSNAEKGSQPLVCAAGVQAAQLHKREITVSGNHCVIVTVYPFRLYGALDNDSYPNASDLHANKIRQKAFAFEISWLSLSIKSIF